MKFLHPERDEGLELALGDVFLLPNRFEGGSRLDVDLTPDDEGYVITAAVRTTGPTGVEMEALTAVAVSALTIYDMVKAVDPSMTIGSIRLVEKTGGKRDIRA